MAEQWELGRNAKHRKRRRSLRRCARFQPCGARLADLRRSLCARNGPNLTSDHRGSHFERTCQGLHVRLRSGAAEPMARVRSRAQLRVPSPALLPVMMAFPERPAWASAQRQELRGAVAPKEGQEERPRLALCWRRTYPLALSFLRFRDRLLDKRGGLLRAAPAGKDRGSPRLATYRRDDTRPQLLNRHID